MFGNAVQADNCAQWTAWGPCVWLKGNNPRWQHSYFDQLLPGKNGCREHIFFKLLRERWSVRFCLLKVQRNFKMHKVSGTSSLQKCYLGSDGHIEMLSIISIIIFAVLPSVNNNVASAPINRAVEDSVTDEGSIPKHFLATVTEAGAPEQGNMYLYGYPLLKLNLHFFFRLPIETSRSAYFPHENGTTDMVNPLFVAERVCVGVDQSAACESKYVEGCKHWPNPNIKLPNVTHTMQEIIDKIDYLSCIPQTKPDGTNVCRCCCHPYVPHATTMKCELKPYLNVNKQQYLYEKVQSVTD
uniref:Secreted protein n=1 Tax=Loa loa TaxID=7209 RepID=A0A1I7VT23_LOALO